MAEGSPKPFRFVPVSPETVKIPHLPPPEAPEEAYADAPVRAETHGLRSFLYRTFMLPLVGLGFFVPSEIPAPPPGQIVQIAPGNPQKAAESQHLDALIRAHRTGQGSADPENVSRGESLAKAIEAVSEIPEKVEDQEDAIRSALDIYATLESKRGKKHEDIAESIKKIREWQSLE